MSYTGFKPIQGNVVVDEFTSSGGSTYTLSSAPSNVNSVEVVVGGLTQTSSAYSFVGTTLTLAGVASGTKIIVRQHGEKLLLQTPADLSVTTGTIAVDAVDGTRLADDAINSEHYTDGSIDLAHIATNQIDETLMKDAFVGDFTDATVTAADTFLYGDATDSGNSKKDTVQGVIDLVHGATAGVSTIWIPALAMVSPTTNGAEAAAVETTAVKPELKVLNFDSSTIEYAQFSIAMPKSWNESTVTAKFYWTHATAVATDVMWGIQGVCVSDNDTIDATFGTAIIVTDTFHNAAEDLAISPETAAITLGGTPAEDDLAYFQVYRAATTGGDTTNSTDAQLIGVKIFFTTNAENDA